MVRTVSEKKGQSWFAGSRCPVTDDQVILKLIHKLVSLQISRKQCPAAIASPSVLCASALSTWFPLPCALLCSVNLPEVTKDLPSYKTVPDKINTIVVLFDEAISNPNIPQFLLVPANSSWLRQTYLIKQKPNNPPLPSLPPQKKRRKNQAYNYSINDSVNQRHEDTKLCMGKYAQSLWSYKLCTGSC